MAASGWMRARWELRRLVAAPPPHAVEAAGHLSHDRLHLDSMNPGFFSPAARVDQTTQARGGGNSWSPHASKPGCALEPRPCPAPLLKGQQLQAPCANPEQEPQRGIARRHVMDENDTSS